MDIIYAYIISYIIIYTHILNYKLEASFLLSTSLCTCMT